jgi:hypothetical protein
LGILSVSFADADGVLHHQGGQPGAVDEDDAAAGLGGGVAGVLRESAGRDEDALAGALELEGSHEALDLRAADAALPALGLDVDLLETEAVEGDDDPRRPGGYIWRTIDGAPVTQLFANLETSTPDSELFGRTGAWITRRMGGSVATAVRSPLHFVALRLLVRAPGRLVEVDANDCQSLDI